MTIKQYYIGTSGPFLIDDAHPLFTDPDQMAKRQDIIDNVIAGDTVVTETAFGQGSAAGISTEFSRKDHTHGTPNNPLSGGLSGTYNFDATTSGNITSLTFTNGILTAYTVKP